MDLAQTTGREANLTHRIRHPKCLIETVPET